MEWRVLRFTPDQGRSFNLQSVTKVRVPASAASPAALLPEFLPLEYTKYLAAVALAALGALGRTDGPLRLLCIGLGGGSLPAFLAAALPACRVDVVESERVVVEALRATHTRSARQGLAVAVAGGETGAAERTASGRWRWALATGGMVARGARLMACIDQVRSRGTRRGWACGDAVGQSVGAAGEPCWTHAGVDGGATHDGQTAL